MKKFTLLLFIALAFAACKKKNPSIDNSVPLSERIPGEWEITQVAYSGLMPNPVNAGQVIPFNGIGQNLSGEFKFTKDPNVGLFNVSFLASIDIGTSQPITVPVSQSHYGEWSTNEANNIVTMWRNDSVYDWTVLKNLANEQTWAAKFYLDFGGIYDSVPVDIQASMTRK